jgi:hypothetical protein
MQNNVGYEIIGKIACMKCYCALCAELRDKMLDVARKQGKDEAITTIVDYDGFQCGAVQSMKEMAHDAWAMLRMELFSNKDKS